MGRSPSQAKFGARLLSSMATPLATLLQVKPFCTSFVTPREGGLSCP